MKEKAIKIIEKIKEVPKEYILIALIITSFVFYSVFSNLFKKEEIKNNNSESIKEEILDEEKAKEGEIYVDLDGAVKNPGVYILKEDARLNDILEKAGGVLENSDMKEVNKAAKLKDGEKVYIPFKGNQKEEKHEEKELDETKEENKKININEAKEEELKKITGVGKATAERIILHRKKYGKFKNIEDIKNVKGISDAKFTKIKDRICV